MWCTGRVYFPLVTATFRKFDRFARIEYDNSSVGEEEHFEMRQLWETLFNWKVIVCCLINASVITPGMFVPILVSATPVDVSNASW